MSLKLVLMLKANAAESQTDVPAMVAIGDELWNKGEEQEAVKVWLRAATIYVGYQLRWIAKERHEDEPFLQPESYQGLALIAGRLQKSREPQSQEQAADCWRRIVQAYGPDHGSLSENEEERMAYRRAIAQLFAMGRGAPFISALLSLTDASTLSCGPLSRAKPIAIADICAEYGKTVLDLGRIEEAIHLFRAGTYAYADLFADDLQGEVASRTKRFHNKEDNLRFLDTIRRMWTPLKLLGFRQLQSGDIAHAGDLLLAVASGYNGAFSLPKAIRDGLVVFHPRYSISFDSVQERAAPCVFESGGGEVLDRYLELERSIWEIGARIEASAISQANSVGVGRFLLGRAAEVYALAGRWDEVENVGDQLAKLGDNSGAARAWERIDGVHMDLPTYVEGNLYLYQRRELDDLCDTLARIAAYCRMMRPRYERVSAKAAAVAEHAAAKELAMRGKKCEGTESWVAEMGHWSRLPRGTNEPH